MWTSLAQLSGEPSLKTARIEFLRGSYANALEALDESPAHAARFLFAAHVLYRMRRRSEVLQQIDAVRAANLLDGNADTQLASAIEAAAAASENDSARARIAIRNVSLETLAGTRVHAEVAYYVASANWMLGKLDAAMAVLDSVDASADENMEARCLFLRGWIYAVKERYAEQVDCNRRALALLESSHFADVGLIAQVLRSLAALARDMFLPAVLELVINAAAKVPWTRDIAADRFQVERTIAWANAMRGEYISAIRQLHQAKNVAPTPQLAMLSHLDHAWVAKISHETLHQQFELSEADAWAEEVDWGHCGDEEVGALMLAAELHAELDTNHALQYLDRARAQQQQMSKGMVLKHDRRLDAYLDFAEASIRSALGERRVAEHRAKRAFKVFVEIGYAWRAANTALLMHKLSGDLAWLEHVQVVAAAYPRSFIANELRRLKVAGSIHVLSKRQRQIVELIRGGLGNDALAAELGISRNTVRVHKAKIFRALGVSSEFELLSRVSGWTAA